MFPSQIFFCVRRKKVQ